VNLERKSSRSVFQRREALQQPRMTRISSVSTGERGAQVMAGWPSWLTSVAGVAFVLCSYLKLLSKEYDFYENFAIHMFIVIPFCLSCHSH